MVGLGSTCSMGSRAGDTACPIIGLGHLALDPCGLCNWNKRAPEQVGHAEGPRLQLRNEQRSS